MENWADDFGGFLGGAIDFFGGVAEDISKIPGQIVDAGLVIGAPVHREGLRTAEELAREAGGFGLQKYSPTALLISAVIIILLVNK